MKKSMKRQIAQQLVEGIRKGKITVGGDGTVTRDGRILKRNISKYILLRMTREGAKLNEAGYYEA